MVEGGQVREVEQEEVYQEGLEVSTEEKREC